MEPGGEARRKMYECDVTYGTNSEFGFDYLRDERTQLLQVAFVLGADDLG